MCKPGSRYRCTNSISVMCDRGNGKPSRQKCRYCGSRLHVESGVWGVFPWRVEGGYRMDTAVSVHPSERSAQSVVDADVSDTLVVRFLVSA
jgi:hypothetical protein